MSAQQPAVKFRVFVRDGRVQLRGAVYPPSVARHVRAWLWLRFGARRPPYGFGTDWPQ